MCSTSNCAMVRADWSVANIYFWAFSEIIHEHNCYRLPVWDFCCLRQGQKEGLFVPPSLLPLAVYSLLISPFPGIWFVLGVGLPSLSLSLGSAPVTSLCLASSNLAFINHRSRLVCLHPAIFLLMSGLSSATSCEASTVFPSPPLIEGGRMPYCIIFSNPVQMLTDFVASDHVKVP